MSDFRQIGKTEKENTLDSKNPAQTHRIIVIGASAGGVSALKEIFAKLPAEFPAPIFIVWHMSADVTGVLPMILNKVSGIYAAHAYDKEEIKPNRIYVAPPDRHMLIEDGHIRLSNGPKENHFRPAIDPLFRSAAFNYGNHVIGVVLSGALDDGMSGLWRIKNAGGGAIVQDPNDAEVPSMPRSAMQKVAVDYCLAANKIADVLVHLIKTKVDENRADMKDERTKIEIDIAAGKNTFPEGSLTIGVLSPFTCPECHGVLSKIAEGDISRYRCHTGHAYSVDTLLATLTAATEERLYDALRGIDESVLLLNHIGDHLAEANKSRLAALHFNKANEAETRMIELKKEVNALSVQLGRPRPYPLDFLQNEK